MVGLSIDWVVKTWKLCYDSCQIRCYILILKIYRCYLLAMMSLTYTNFHGTPMSVGVLQNCTCKFHIKILNAHAWLASYDSLTSDYVIGMHNAGYPLGKIMFSKQQQREGTISTCSVNGKVHHPQTGYKLPHKSRPMGWGAWTYFLQFAIYKVTCPLAATWHALGLGKCENEPFQRQIHYF